MKTLNCHYEMLNPNIVSSDNCYVVDENGKSYVDFESGVWCVSVGHNNKRVNEAIIRQIGAISHVGGRYSSKIVDQAAGRVLNLLDFADGKCVFLSSGSEAVEFAVRSVQKVMNKPYFLCLKNHYLSAYGMSAARDKKQWISLDLSEYCRNPANYLKDTPFDKIGTFVFEPGNASGMVKLPPADLINVIADKLKENGGIIVVNEVTTGIGRTGKWFGYQHYNIRPDVVVMGKGIGNGYPVSVVALSKHVTDLIEKSDFRYLQSHQDDPLGCAVVNEVIQVIESNGHIQRAARMGDMLEHELKSLQKRHGCVKEMRGIGLMYVMEFYDTSLSLEKVHKELFNEGYIVGHTASANLLRFYPPLTIDEGQIRSMAGALDAVLSKENGNRGAKQ